MSRLFVLRTRTVGSYWPFDPGSERISISRIQAAQTLLGESVSPIERRNSRFALALALSVTSFLHALPAEPQCVPSQTLSPALLGQSGCHLTALGLTPLSDLGCGTYRGEPGGLYPGGAETPPAAHWLAGWNASSEIVPRASDGEPDLETGRIGLASIGMSNTAAEFSSFVTLARFSSAVSPRVVVVNGAQGGRPAEVWAQPASPVWDVLDQRLAAAGLTPRQLQAVWIKQANGNPSQLGAFPAHAEALQEDLRSIVQIAKARYPNLAVAYLSSRTRAYVVGPNGLNPEPFAYESGFSVKWLIEAQIAGDPTLRFTGPAAPAPWLAWGPYLWADGETPREDGFTWSCTDTASDFTHPSFAGSDEIARHLMHFFGTEITARGWFLAPVRSSCGLLGIEPVIVLAAVYATRRLRRTRRNRALA